MKKFLICEVVIALFALTGFYYFLSNSPPVRMPERPIASAPEVIAAALPQAVEKPEVIKAEPASVAEQTVTIAVLSPAPFPAEAGAGNVDNYGVVSSDNADNAESDAGGTSVAETEPVTPESVEERPVVVTEGSAVEDKTVPGKDVISERESVAPVVEESSVSTPVAPVIVVGDYVLHVDLLRDQNRLQALNIKSRTEVVSRPTPIFRVYLGPFKERGEALAMMVLARDKGDDPFLLIRKGLYKVVIGSFYLQSSVDDWKKLYGAAGFPPKVQKVTIKMPHTLLLLDDPRIRQSSDEVLTQLHDAGFPDAHLR